MAIVQQITQFPPAPNSTTDTPQQFNTKANTFVGHQSGTYVPEVNQWAVEANQLATDIAAITAGLPAGTINDTTIGADKVYSNQKTEAEYKIISGDTSGKHYVKYPDGTLIQWRASTTSYITDTAIGALFRNTNIPQETFLIPFVGDLPVVTWSAGNGANGWVSNAGAGSTSFSACRCLAMGVLATTTVIPSYMAIGRWK